MRMFRRLKALFTWDSRDRDMDQEMAFHVESLARDYISAGMTAEEATRAARQRFGSVLHMKERGHDARSSRILEDLLRDLRHAGRGLRRAPGFAAAVVLTLALGIGGNTAIFSVVDQLLLRPLPYPNGDQLVVINEDLLVAPVRARALRPRISPANWLDWQRERQTFQSIAAWFSTTVTLTGVGEPVRLDTQLVSHEFFPLLRVAPLLGRVIAEPDDRPNAPPVAVISYGLWQQRFGGDRGVAGRIVTINGMPTEIVGVMPETFRFVSQTNDVWAPFRLDRAFPWRDSAGRFMNAIGRLQPEVSLTAARTGMSELARRIAETHQFNRGFTFTVTPMREELTGQVQTSLLVLYGAVGVLLSIACFNVANLLLARAAARRREIAIRTSLGAGRSAIVRQLLVESVLLSVLGGALGIGLAYWSLDALVAFAPPDLLRVPDLYVDRRVMVYALGLSVLTGLVVGLVPALSVASRSFAARMRTSGYAVTHSPRVRQALVVAQVAMTVVLLSGAGLLMRTIVALDAADSGFDKRDMLTMEVTLPGARYTGERRSEFISQAIVALRELPGVRTVVAANSLPIIGTPAGGSSFTRLGAPPLQPGERQSTLIRVVTPGYFKALGIAVRQGREFTGADTAAASGFVVNEAFVRRFLQGVDPLTASLSVRMQDENPHLPVIGIVGDISEGTIRNGAEPTVYYGHRRFPVATMTLFVRADAAAGLGRSAVAALHRLDPALAVSSLRTLDDAFAESVARERLNALVSGAFAVSGLLLASLGLYGLLAFLVTERTKEIGIRIALGAKLSRLSASVVGGGFRLVGIGAAAGVAGSLLLSRSLDTLLFGVTLYDMTTYAVVLGLLGAVTALASYIPARRAARIQPLIALRQE